MATTARSTYPREGVYADDLRAPAVRRISWGAIVAGVVVVLVVQMALMLLGLAIGTATIDPAMADTPQASTLGLGGGVWWIGATAVSVFLGAWVSGRLAGMPSGTDGMLHGVVTWAVATLFAIYLLSTAIGGLVGGAFGALGSAAQAVGQGTQSLASTAMQVLPDDIRGQAERLFDRAPAAAGQVQQEVQQTQQAAGGGSMLDAVQRVVRGVQEGASPQDRDAALNVIAQQAGIPREQAEQRLTEFQATYRQYRAAGRRAGAPDRAGRRRDRLAGIVLVGRGPGAGCRPGGTRRPPRHTARRAPLQRLITCSRTPAPETPSYPHRARVGWPRAMGHGWNGLNPHSPKQSGQVSRRSRPAGEPGAVDQSGTARRTWQARASHTERVAQRGYQPEPGKIITCPLLFVALGGVRDRRIALRRRSSRRDIAQSHGSPATPRRPGRAPNPNSPFSP